MTRKTVFAAIAFGVCIGGYIMASIGTRPDLAIGLFTGILIGAAYALLIHWAVNRK